MSEKRRKSRTDWSKVESHAIGAEEYRDMPEWTEAQIKRAEFAVGDKIIRPARGSLTRPPGRPKAVSPKRSVHLRLSPDVLAHFRSTGKGWQTRIDDVLRKAAKLGPRKNA